MLDPIRVLVVTVVHDPEDARIRHRQIPALLDAGHRVAYAAPFTAYGRTVPPGVRAIDIPRAQGRRRLGAVIAARRVVAQIGPSADVVLVHDPDLLLAVAGLRGVRVVWDVHEDTASALSMRSWVPRRAVVPLQAAVRVTERLAERRYGLLLAERGYQDRFRRRHPVVPNSVTVPDTPPELPSGPPRAVYLGKLSRARGAAELLALARTVPEVRIQLIGPADASTRPALEQARSDGVLDWAEFLPNDQALRHLAGATVGLVLLHDEPNYTHSLPTKMVEYLAHGVPVITTPNTVARELAETSGGGIVVPFGDVEAAASALRALAADPVRQQVMARSGHAYVRDHVNWTRDGPAFAATLAAMARAT